MGIKYSTPLFDYEKQLLDQSPQYSDYLEESYENSSNIIRTKEAIQKLNDCYELNETESYINKDGETKTKLETLVDILEYGCYRFKDHNILGTQKYEDDGSRSEYLWMSINDFREDAINSSKGLKEMLKLGNKENIGIFSINRVEWCVASWGNFSQTYRTVPIYDTFGEKAIEYILIHSKIKVIYSEKNKVKTLLDIMSKTEKKEQIQLQCIVQFDYDPRWNNKSEKIEEANIKLAESININLVGLSKVKEIGKNSSQELDLPNKEDLAFIMYTSGTTGDPKGVMITHQNVTSTAGSVKNQLHFSQNDCHFSFLTLSHIYENICHVCFFIKGTKIAFYSGNLKNLLDDIKKSFPTIICGVPRFFQKIHDNIIAKVNTANYITKYFFYKALYESSIEIRKGRRSSVNDKRVWFKLRKKLGLSNLRYVVTGAAPIPNYLYEFLRILFGCPVLQGYGLTETSGGIAISDTEDITLGHCGPPIQSCEIKLVDIPDMNYTHKDLPCPRGEIWVRGVNVFKGYYNEEEKTKEAFPDGDGFFATGDVGRLNKSGTISIIDRKKHIFKLSQGEYIAVEKIEGIYTESEAISQIWVYGDSMKSYIVAVIVPSVDWTILEGKKMSLHTEKIKIDSKDFQNEFNHFYKENYSTMNKKILSNMKSVEQNLKGFEKVNKILIESNVDKLGNGFTVENDCMTPSFKIKRVSMKKKYIDELNKLYDL